MVLEMETNKNTKTVGAAAIELQSKADGKQSVMDTKDAMLKSYPDALVKCAKSKDWTEPFYVCVQSRRERLLNNVIRNQFYARKTRPIPQFDLALYHYDPSTEDLRFVWCIPDKESVINIMVNRANGTLPHDQSKLYDFCVGFINGTLV